MAGSLPIIVQMSTGFIHAEPTEATLRPPSPVLAKDTSKRPIWGGHVFIRLCLSFPSLPSSSIHWDRQRSVNNALRIATKKIAIENNAGITDKSHTHARAFVSSVILERDWIKFDDLLFMKSSSAEMLMVAWCFIASVKMVDFYTSHKANSVAEKVIANMETFAHEVLSHCRVIPQIAK